MNVEMEDSRPPPPCWLDKDFIQRALRAGDGDSTITVTSYEIFMANAVGDGYASDMYRVIAKLDSSEERRVVIKCQPQGEKIKEFVKNSGIFKIETNMLTKTLPAMHKLLNEVRPGKYQPFYAECLYHGNDPVPFLVLEDLRQSGFTLARRQQGVDLAHCSLALRTLARFHASSLALLEQDPTAMECYSAIFSEDVAGMLASFFENSLQIFTEVVSKWQGFEKYACALSKLKGKVYNRVAELFTRKADNFNVLLHGDPWTNNMMFKYSGCVPEDIRLVDYQTCTYSCVALDVLYFLYACPSEEVRIQHMDSLIQKYHSTLLETLDLLNVTEHSISLEQLNSTLDEFMFYGLMASVCVMPIVLSDPEDGYDFTKALDDDISEQRYNTKIYKNTAYITAMKRLLPIFEEKGLLVV
ncbi:uncharacterized protein [Anabrus simplex]|uniref:uncharacterized protein n=1 Tax=Anabrus simplex TaxID=316456 RepID=UPI0035A37A15